VLIHDPQPVNAGSLYWLTWRGFACGSKLGGHCLDYFNIQGSGEKCTSALDDLGCTNAAEEYEQIHQISEAETAITALLGSDAGSKLRAGLVVPDSVRRIVCNQRLLIHGARILFSPAGLPSLSKIGTTRLLCELQGETWRDPASIFLIDREQGGWLLAGFGASRTTQWLRQSADPLLSALGQGAAIPGLPPPEPMNLYEVEIPGTGDLLLVAPGGNLTFHFQAPEGLVPRSLLDVLKDPAGGIGSPTLESLLRNLPPGD
jgi:hypothetical protein